MAKLWAAEVAAEAALACAEEPGGEDGSLHERLGDARAIGRVEGSSEVEAEIVARRLLE
jgi:alkylation response protein AidB-like acyl-CoA dehydrogenase